MKILPDENIIYKKRGSFKAFFDCHVYSRKHKEVSSAWLFWFMRICIFLLILVMWGIYTFYNAKTDEEIEILEVLITLLLSVWVGVILLPLSIQIAKKTLRSKGIFAAIIVLCLMVFLVFLLGMFIVVGIVEESNLQLGMFGATGFTVLVVLYWLCKAKSSLIIITNKRMLIKTGIIFQDSTITDLRRVATIDIKQSIVGSMIGCGALVFHGYGIGGFCLPFMSRPTALRDEILKAQSGITDDGQKIDDDVLDEY